MCVSKTNVFIDSLLAMVQVPGFDKSESPLLFVHSDVVGLARALTSTLFWRFTKKKEKVKCA